SPRRGRARRDAAVRRPPRRAALAGRRAPERGAGGAAGPGEAGRALLERSHARPPHRRDPRRAPPATPGDRARPAGAGAGAAGGWGGLTAGEMEGAEPERFAEWMANVGAFPFPEGESVPDLAARAWPAFEALADAHPGEAIAIVAHGGTNRALLCRVLGLP